MEELLKQIINERDILRQQNDKLWILIQEQKSELDQITERNLELVRKLTLYEPGQSLDGQHEEEVHERVVDEEEEVQEVGNEEIGVEEDKESDTFEPEEEFRHISQQTPKSESHPHSQQTEKQQEEQQQEREILPPVLPLPPTPPLPKSDSPTLEPIIFKANQKEEKEEHGVIHLQKRRRSSVLRKRHTVFRRSRSFSGYDFNHSSMGGMSGTSMGRSAGGGFTAEIPSDMTGMTRSVTGMSGMKEVESAGKEEAVTETVGEEAVKEVGDLDMIKPLTMERSIPTPATPTLTPATTEPVTTTPTTPPTNNTTTTMPEPRLQSLFTVPQSFHERYTLLQNQKHLKVLVLYSSVRLNSKHKEYTTFILSVQTLLPPSQQTQSQYNTPNTYSGSSNPQYTELWRIEKKYSDFLDLHNQIKQHTTKEILQRIQKVPQKQLFRMHGGMAPHKTDQRNQVLEMYLESILEACFYSYTQEGDYNGGYDVQEGGEDILRFLCLNVIELMNNTTNPNGGNAGGSGRVFENSLKEGYLTKRGKTFGIWKRRYFVLFDDLMMYFDTQESALSYYQSQQQQQREKEKEQIVSYTQYSTLSQGVQESNTTSSTYSNIGGSTSGTLRRLSMSKHGILHLKNARVSIQKPPSQPYSSQPNTSTNQSEYRHALMIREAENEYGDQKRSILCAESDLERDDWVYYITKQIEYLSMSSKNAVSAVSTTGGSAVSQGVSQSGSKSTGGMTGQSNSRETGTVGNRGTLVGGGFYIPPPPDSLPPSASQSLSRTAVTQSVHPVDAVEGEGEEGVVDSGNAKQRSKFISWATHSQKSNENLSELATQNNTSTTTQNTTSNTPSNTTGNVFGVPLEQAIAYSKVKDGYELPSIVYRCIEYLEYKQAYLEEGLYRINGTQSRLIQLRQMFEERGDVDLIQLERDSSETEGVEGVDVHTVASLLKLYLRSLPESILTPTLHREFLFVSDLLDRSDKIIELARLVSYLPIPNYTLLRTLMGHLLKVVKYEQRNKMGVGNVGMVFAPSMNVPGGVFGLLLREFEFIFWVGGEEGEHMTEEPNEEVTEPAPDPTADHLTEPTEEMTREMTDMPTAKEVTREMTTAKEMTTTTTNKRQSWLPNQIIVEERDKRNSQIYESNAPDIVRMYEHLIHDSSRGSVLILNDGSQGEGEGEGVDEGVDFYGNHDMVEEQDMPAGTTTNIGMTGEEMTTIDKDMTTPITPTTPATAPQTPTSDTTQTKVKKLSKSKEKRKSKYTTPEEKEKRRLEKMNMSPQERERYRLEKQKRREKRLSKRMSKKLAEEKEKEVESISTDLQEPQQENMPVPVPVPQERHVKNTAAADPDAKKKRLSLFKQEQRASVLMMNEFSIPLPIQQQQPPARVLSFYESYVSLGNPSTPANTPANTNNNSTNSTNTNSTRKSFTTTTADMDSLGRRSMVEVMGVEEDEISYEYEYEDVPDSGIYHRESANPLGI